MARSLARNTRLFVSTENDDLTTVAPSPTNLFEVKVLDGYSFSQDAATQEIGVNEAGTSPVRGTLGFNTALNPVDVSFSTYVRSFYNQIDAVNLSDCVEKVLWGSAMGTKAGWDASPAATLAATYDQDTTSLDIGLTTSNANELMSLTLYFVLEQTTYKITDFNVSTAEVDFSIDGISLVNWSGNGSRVLEDLNAHNLLTGSAFKSDVELDTVTGASYKGVPATQTNTFLRNKLGTLDLRDRDLDQTPENPGIVLTTAVYTAGVGTVLTLPAGSYPNTLIGGRVLNKTTTGINSSDVLGWSTIIAVDDILSKITVAEDLTTAVQNGVAWTDAVDVLDTFNATDSAGVVYTVPITGATLTLENSFTYLTPEELAIVNLPLAGFAGNRVISGSLTAYLNTGATGTGGLLQDMLAKITDSVSNNFELIFHMGGSSTDTPRVDFTVAHANISVPTTNVEDIIATEITFTGKPWNGDDITGAGSFEDTNELVINYYRPQ